MKTFTIKTDGTTYGTDIILNNKKLGGIKKLEMVMTAGSPLMTVNITPEASYKEEWEKELEGNDGAKLIWDVQENTQAMARINIL
jgi:hypothetical protein